MASKIISRALSEENKIALIIGIFSIVTSILSILLAWATWRLTRNRRRRLAAHESKSQLRNYLAFLIYFLPIEIIFSLRQYFKYQALEFLKNGFVH